VVTATRQNRTFAIAFGAGTPWDFRGANGQTSEPARGLAQDYGTATVITDPSSAIELTRLREFFPDLVILRTADVLIHFDSPTLAALCSELSELESLQALTTGHLSPRSGVQTSRSRLPLFTAALGFAGLGIHPSIL
jgi:hypothetical protein